MMRLNLSNDKLSDLELVEEITDTTLSDAVWNALAKLTSRDLSALHIWLLQVVERHHDVNE